MKKKQKTLSEADIRRLLIEKQRASRRQRITHFQETGKITTEKVLEGERTGRRPQRTRDKGPISSILLAIEVFAVLVIVGVFLASFLSLRDLNEDIADSFLFPTPSPTPLIVAVVLPSGHTPPTSPGGSRPNDAEIPEHLQPLVQAQANIPLPTAAPAQGIRIQIPQINVDAPIIQGTGWEQLKKGVGQYIGSGLPGQNGNMVLAAHNDIFGEIFRDLDQLKPGDRFTIFSNQRAFTYVVQDWQIVPPTQVEVMNTTPDATVTLISCYPYLINTERIVVTAKLLDS